MSDDELVVERHDAVLVARLNRPEARNALSPGLMFAIGAALLTAENDPGIRAVVLTGTGDRAFCAGLDLKAFAAGELDMQASDEMAVFTRLLRGEIRVPVIGAANGAALAGGLELLLGCDLIVLAEGVQLGLPEVKRGLVAGGGGTFIGTRIPLSIALELTLTGDNLDATRALEVGLANAVVPADQLLDAAMGFAERIAANGPLGVAATKELVRLAVFDAPAAWDRLDVLRAEVFASEDAKEGATAFIEKRSPVWKGR